MSAAPPLRPEHALLLDLDGTLLDIAATPDAVIVPPGLIDDLGAIRVRQGGALAILSGRPIEAVAALLGDAPTAIAGEHGAAFRHAVGGPIERPDLPSPPVAWLAEAASFAASHRGVLLERKSRGFVLHYRLAPAAGEAAHALLAPLVAKASDFVLLAAHKAWEVRPAGIDKGRALDRVIRRSPFAGRVPFFIGDDVTDEDAIRAAQAAGGIGLRVAEAFGDAAGVRAWLARVTRSG